jgi:hypothetical protein
LLVNEKCKPITQVWQKLALLTGRECAESTVGTKDSPGLSR